jgi:hypothetical protein
MSFLNSMLYNCVLNKGNTVKFPVYVIQLRNMKTCVRVWGLYKAYPKAPRLSW